MRSGTWSGRRSTSNVRVWVNGTLRPVLSVSISSGMRDGHPNAESWSWCVTSKIDWSSPDMVATGSPEPFSGTSWMPTEGDSIVVETGEAVTGEWFVQHRGHIDSTSGSIADGTARSLTVDRIDELGGPVSMWAALARSAPSVNGADYRYVGMSSTFLVDRMLRHSQDISGTNPTGWYATPPVTWQTVGSAPCMGSLIPEVGYIREAHRKSDPLLLPAWYTTPYGVTASDYTATYDLSSPASTPILSLGILDEGDGYGWIQVVDDDNRGVRIQYDRGTGLVGVAIIGASPGQSWHWWTLGSNRRVAAYLRRDSASSQTVILRLEDGTERTYSGTATNFPAGWAATKVQVETDIPLGWWIVETNKPESQRWATIDHVPTARARIGNHGFMVQSRSIYLEDAARWLQDHVDAEFSTMWMDEDGVMQYTSRDILDVQNSVATVTSQSDVADVTWEASGRRRARNLSITYTPFDLMMGADGLPTVTVWEGSSSDIAPGAEDVNLVNSPADEDWFSVDTNPRHVSEWGQPWNYYRVGSTFGGSQYAAATSSDSVWALFLDCTMERLNPLSFRVSFAPWSTMSATFRVNARFPDKAGSPMSGGSALVLRARAKTVTRDVEDLSQVNTSGRGTYSHDVGWHVQQIEPGGALHAMKAWLTDVVANKIHLPTVTGLVIRHDPRLQIGDVIRVEDRHRTGLWWNVIIQSREIDPDDFTDTISGRVVSTSTIPGLSLPTAPGHTPTTPPNDWTREVAP